MGIKRTFRNVLMDYIRWLDGDRETETKYSNNSNKVSSAGMVGKAHTLEDDNGLNFTIYNATGGKLVKVTSYDRARDRMNSSLHIVTDKEDLGEELAQIITRENLSR